jgi:hypothetical protein
MMMMNGCRTSLRFAFTVLSLAWLSGSPVMAEDAAQSGEPTLEECTKALHDGRDKASKLSAKSLSRYFAERFLQNAEAEAGNGEYDGCLEYVEKAIDEIDNRRHWLAPGETFRATTSTGYMELRGDDQ